MPAQFAFMKSVSGRFELGHVDAAADNLENVAELILDGNGSHKPMPTVWRSKGAFLYLSGVDCFSNQAGLAGRLAVMKNGIAFFSDDVLNRCIHKR